MKFKDRKKSEQKAINKYIRDSHPTNLPENVDTAKWVFYKNRLHDCLDAAL